MRLFYGTPATFCALLSWVFADTLSDESVLSVGLFWPSSLPCVLSSLLTQENQAMLAEFIGGT